MRSIDDSTRTNSNDFVLDMLGVCGRHFLYRLTYSNFMLIHLGMNSQHNDILRLRVLSPFIHIHITHIQLTVRFYYPR